MQNYFNYYTEIEDHFQRRRGTLLMLSTLDWALIATWQEAGFPLEAVLRGINAAFDKYDARKGRRRTQKINGLAYCAQEVLRAVEDLHEAATGVVRKNAFAEESGFEAARIAAYLSHAAQALNTASVSSNAREVFQKAGKQLAELAGSIEGAKNAPQPFSVESLEQRLIALEDQLFAALQTFASPEELVALRERSAQELAPYRSRLETAQIRQIEQQFLRRCLFQQHNVPRLSLFYMPQT